MIRATCVGGVNSARKGHGVLLQRVTTAGEVERVETRQVRISVFDRSASYTGRKDQVITCGRCDITCPVTRAIQIGWWITTRPGKLRRRVN